MEKTVKNICPGCQQERTAWLEWEDEDEKIQHLQVDEYFHGLNNVAELTGIPISALLAEAQEIAESLREALPLLENKYNICSVCGEKKE